MHTESCHFCQQPVDFDQVFIEVEVMRDAAAGGEDYLPEVCCEEFGAYLHDHADEYADDFFARCTFASDPDARLRSLCDDRDGREQVDFNLRLKKLAFVGVRQFVQDFVRRHHRHNRPPAVWKFAFGAYNGEELVAVMTVGTPVARGWSDGVPRLEVTRLCVNHDLPKALVMNACTMLYSEAARETNRISGQMTKESGRNPVFKEVITYTVIGETAQGDPVRDPETGEITYRPREDATTLLLAGWQKGHVVRGGRTWSCQSRPREDADQPNAFKQCWFKVLRNSKHRQQPERAAA